MHGTHRNTSLQSALAGEIGKKKAQNGDVRFPLRGSTPATVDILRRFEAAPDDMLSCRFSLRGGI